MVDGGLDVSHSTTLGNFGGVFVLLHRHDVGDPMQGHKHDKHHVTFVTSGRVRVEWARDDGTTGSKTFEAPTFFIQDKDVMHKVVPLEDGSTWWCVFSLTEEEAGEPIVASANNPYSD